MAKVSASEYDMLPHSREDEEAPIYLVFTGHRDRLCRLSALVGIAIALPSAIWVHGGAKGFDSQVAKFAKENGIEQLCVRPDYKQYGRAAPLVRNREMVDIAHRVFACYDGRKTGGTWYTIEYARKKGKATCFLDAYYLTGRPVL